MAFVFDEAEKALRAQEKIPTLRGVGADQSIEVGELVRHPIAPIAHAQRVGLLGQFIPEWVKIREKWLKAGAPGSMISDERPVITPQISDLNLIDTVRRLKKDLIRTAKKTFPNLAFVLGE